MSDAPKPETAPGFPHRSPGRGASNVPTPPRKTEAAGIQLEAMFAAPVGPQGAAMADALRLLAVWAVRAARQGHVGAPEAPQGPEGSLDFRRPSSEECAAEAGDEMPATAKET